MIYEKHTKLSISCRPLFIKKYNVTVLYQLIQTIKVRYQEVYGYHANVIIINELVRN